MDELATTPPRLFPIGDVEQFLAEDQSRLDTDKKAIELWAGLVTAKFMAKAGARGLRVGFPTTMPRQGPVPPSVNSVMDLLEHREVICDEDIDVIVDGTSPMRLVPLQVTRFLTGGWQGLLGLITKKYRVAESPGIALVVLLQDAITIRIDDLYKYIRDHSSPYGRVFLVGRVNADKGEFGLIDINGSDVFDSGTVSLSCFPSWFQVSPTRKRESP